MYRIAPQYEPKRCHFKEAKEAKEAQSSKLKAQEKLQAQNTKEALEWGN
jgi:hypothetical protein